MTVRDEISSVTFTISTDEQIRSNSVLEVTAPQAFDALSNVLPNGLYDMRLGPLDKTAPCVTCSQMYINCPGHSAHIELCVPLYNPLTYPSLLLYLKCKCQSCHNFKCGKLKSQIFNAKINLINRGMVNVALSLDDKIEQMQVIICSPHLTSPHPKPTQPTPTTNPKLNSSGKLYQQMPIILTTTISLQSNPLKTSSSNTHPTR